MSECPTDPAPTREERRARLGELARLFLRLGTIAFGGPAAHIAIMEDEVVRRRQWLTHQNFLDMIGACSLIPGPNSTEMAIHIGHRRAGFAGLLVAGGCFIAPATAITIAIAWTYVRFGSMPQVAGALYGIKPVIIAVIGQALWRLLPRTARTLPLAALTVVATVAALAGLNEIAILFVGGLVAMAAAEGLRSPRPSSGAGAAAVALPSAMLAAPKAGAALAAAAPFSLGKMFLLFVKIGSVLFGSGYVLLAFLQADFVDRLHWLSQGQLLDAVAVGQFTPGPVFCTATFVGYLLAASGGALAATAGIFLPAFVFVALSGPLLPRLRGSAGAGAFLDGVNAASMALMVAVTWQLGREAVIDATTALLAALAALALIRYRINSAWLIVAGGLVGAIVGRLPR